jgi:hypothetical protein
MMMMYVDEIFHDGGKAKWVLVVEQERGKTILANDRIMTVKLWASQKNVTLVTQLVCGWAYFASSFCTPE